MKKIIFFLIIFFGVISCAETTKTSFKIGVVSDCQYCDCEIKWDRYYKKAPQRLKEAVAILNRDTLSYTIHLGAF